MGVATTPAAPAQRQTRPRPRRPRTDEELAEREADRVHRWLSRIRAVRVHLTAEESRIYNRLSRHDGDGQVTLIWSLGEWAVRRRGERGMALVEESLDLYALVEILYLMECTIEETASRGRRRMNFRRE